MLHLTWKIIPWKFLGCLLFILQVVQTFKPVTDKIRHHRLPIGFVWKSATSKSTSESVPLSFSLWKVAGVCRIFRQSHSKTSYNEIFSGWLIWTNMANHEYFHSVAIIYPLHMHHYKPCISFIFPSCSLYISLYFHYCWYDCYPLVNWHSYMEITMSIFNS